MKRFIESEDRRQATLLPDSLEDYATDESPVRVIDVFIDELDLAAMGFAGVAPEAPGRPAYHPATLLKSIFTAISIASNRADRSNGFSTRSLDNQAQKECLEKLPH